MNLLQFVNETKRLPVLKIREQLFIVVFYAFLCWKSYVRGQYHKL